MAHLDRAALHRIEHLRPWHDLARRKHLNLKPVLAQLGNAAGHVFRRPIERTERPPGRRHQLGHGLGNGGAAIVELQPQAPLP